jgi:putative copper resistance protein D
MAAPVNALVRSRSSALASGRAVPPTVGVAAPLVLAVGAAGAVVFVALVEPAAVLAHGADSLSPPTPADILLDWAFDPLLAIPLLLMAAAYLWAVRHVDAAHPAHPVPRARIVAFLAGLAAIEIALQSVVERYDTTLFSVHMLQHVLLTLVASPLLALGSPITLLLRVTRAGFRRRFILPILHSRVVRVLAFPVVSWSVFAAVMWGTHFSPLFERSLEDPFIHDLEHLLYLTAGLLFWWPAVALDPAPWRMPHPVRAMYLFLQMPQNSFLALAIYSASAPLYAHYAGLGLTWGPTALVDQRLAGGLMWIIGDLVFVSAIVLVVGGWMRFEERDTRRREAHADAEMAVIHAREVVLAERLARERAAAAGESPDPRSAAPALPASAAPDPRSAALPASAAPDPRDFR